MNAKQKYQGLYCATFTEYYGSGRRWTGYEVFIPVAKVLLQGPNGAKIQDCQNGRIYNKRKYSLTSIAQLKAKSKNRVKFLAKLEKGKYFGRHNFFEYSAADFKPCKSPDRAPDFVSPSGSEYWYTKMGVIRRSDHWGQVASCDWFLEKRIINTLQTGYCKFSKFKHKSFS